jgi:hypothetical protein
MSHTTDEEDFDIFYKAALQLREIYERWAQFYWANPWVREAPDHVCKTEAARMSRSESLMVEALLADLRARRPEFAQEYQMISTIIVNIIWARRVVPADRFEAAIRTTWKYHLDGTLKARWAQAEAEVHEELRSKCAA